MNQLQIITAPKKKSIFGTLNKIYCFLIIMTSMLSFCTGSKSEFKRGNNEISSEYTIVAIGNFNITRMIISTKDKIVVDTLLKENTLTSISFWKKIKIADFQIKIQDDTVFKIENDTAYNYIILKRLKNKTSLYKSKDTTIAVW